MTYQETTEVAAKERERVRQDAWKEHQGVRDEWDARVDAAKRRENPD